MIEFEVIQSTIVIVDRIHATILQYERVCLICTVGQERKYVSKGIRQTVSGRLNELRYALACRAEISERKQQVVALDIKKANDALSVLTSSTLGYIET